VEISEVRIKLMDDPHDRLQAFCSITFDGCFVIRDLKIIQGAKGPFVAMPSRKLTDRCPKCHCKNHLRSLFCNQCGAKLDEERATRGQDGRAKLYADIAHPINSLCREHVQARVLDDYEQEKVRAQQPGYTCTYDDYGEDQFATLRENNELEPEQTPEPTPTTPEPAPARYVEQGGTRHRIEPAEAQTGPPHVDRQPVPRETTHQSTGSAQFENDNQDEFGQGL